MYLKHKIRKNPNRNGFKNEIQIVSNYVEPKILSRRYKVLFITAFILMIFISTTAFIVNPLFISFRLFTPELIILLVSEVLLIPILILMFIEKRHKIRSASKAERITHDVILFIILISFISFILMMIAFVAFSISYLVLTTRKNVLLRSFVVGFLAVLIAPLSYFVTLMTVGYITQLPKNETTSFLIQNSSKNNGLNKIPTNKELNILSWNIGYAATGSEADYFYDEKFNGENGSYGKAPSLDVVNNHLDGIKQFLDAATHVGKKITTSYDEKNPRDKKSTPVSFANQIDFGFLQEVDKPSVRSMYTDQPSIIANTIGDEYDVEFVRNIKNAMLPVPLFDANGQVEGGLLTFSKYNVDHSKARRISLNSAGSGVDGIFNLKRAIGLIDFRVDNGKILHLANIHASAFPQDYLKREKEYFRLIQLIEEWKKDGNYFIVGGDWNTDILDAYYYTQAKNKFSGAGQWISEEDRKENIFGQNNNNINEVQPLSVMNIAKYPNEFRKYVKVNNLKLGADNARNHASMRSNGDKWEGPFPIRNGKRLSSDEDWDLNAHNYEDLHFNKDTDYVPSVAVIDGFITSSNVTINRTETIQQGWHKNTFNKAHPYLFADSDHNPVLMSFKLN